MQWPWSWKQKGEVWPGWGLSLPPSPPLAQPSEGYHAQKTPGPTPCAWAMQRGRYNTVHSWSWGRSWQGSGLTSPSLLERVAQALVGFLSNLLTCTQTNCLDSTCAEPYCVFMFLFKREVYLAIIINKWIFFSEVTVHASSRCFSPLRSQQGSPGTYQTASLSGRARLSQPPDLPYT